MDALGVSEGELAHFKWKGFHPKPLFLMTEMFIKTFGLAVKLMFFTKGFLKGQLVPVHFCLQCKIFNPQPLLQFE